MSTSNITTDRIQRIQTLAAELDQLGRTALEKAVEAGNLLAECKATLAHGEWLPWLESNFSFTDRTARRWMKLADDLATGKLKSDTVSNLAEAYRITTEPTEAKETKERLCPFEMPLPGQRLVLLLKSVSSGRHDNFAAIEPMDETYVQVTWTENVMDEFFGNSEILGSVAGTTRGIHKDHAWRFLVEGAPRGSEWKNAIGALVPWERPESKTTQNPNLMEYEFGWLEDCWGLYDNEEEAA